MAIERYEKLSAMLLAAIGAFSCIFAGAAAFQGYLSPYAALITAIGGFGIWSLGNWIGAKSHNRDRCASIEKLSERAPADLLQEYTIVSQRGDISRDNVERIWNGLATFYEVPPSMLRATDVLRGDLAGMMGHIDYDPFFCPLIHLHKGPAQDALKEVYDWADLIRCFHQFEQESGRQGTKRIKRDGETTWIWEGN